MIAAAVIVVLLAGLALVGPALAGDAVAQFDFGEEERTASPGETVTVDVVLRSDGGYAGEGIESYSFVVAVPPEVGEPTSVEAGPWLARDGGSVEQTVTDAGEGAIRVRHEQADAEDGVTGAGVAATVTIELREDAPASDATVLIADPDAQLHGSDFPMRSLGDEATIVVDGGGEQLEPAYQPGDRSGDGVDVTTANETNRTPESGDDAGAETDGGGANSGDDSLPGFGLGASILALGVLAAVAGAVRR
ncbi:hypothetical protein L593_13280 [Salinarchaeum sp. Harcht-Bsk1]|uniref:hypothetical protein n=1 Tax=Salinarchaeum sp. Harcht-Bsk1 TaxID=1333523 RepID=UPI0003422CBD|nr:hypothetical protein [Salinarchaeum sp. Harcht-Bsk1]AGN02595.1 hypothetical protein L593_13280 [Salinarchaeum sp. Harcht-Bsk1]